MWILIFFHDVRAMAGVHVPLHIFHVPDALHVPVDASFQGTHAVDAQNSQLGDDQSKY
jgi:hypothetical protein